MNRLADHLMIAPVVLPLVAGALMLALGGERHRNVNAAINVVTTFVLVAIAIALLRAADAAPSGVSGVYRVGNWAVPFGIVLVLDRLAALMLLLTSFLRLLRLCSRSPDGTASGCSSIPCFNFC
jgi:multicomponent K+:H+ antiporter subunit D